MTTNDIRESKTRENNGCYTVCVDADGKTTIFSNRDDEYILNERFSIVARCETFKEAVKKEKRYQYRNLYYLVVSTKIDGVTKLKLRKYEGVMYRAPIGTIGVFKRRRDAKKYMSLKNASNKNAANKKSA